MKKIIFAILVIFSFSVNVRAASLCSAKEQLDLRKEVANVKADYETKNEDLDTGNEFVQLHYYIQISILNLTENFYMVITNDVNDEQLTFYSNDAVDGIITFNWDEVDEITRMTIKVYSSDNTSCPDEEYKTIYLSLPRYNYYSRYEICNIIPDFNLCQEFVSVKEFDENNFWKQVENYRNEHPEETQDKPSENTNNISNSFLNFLNKYKFYILGVIMVAIIVSASYLVIKKFKNNRGKSL